MLVQKFLKQISDSDGPIKILSEDAIHEMDDTIFCLFIDELNNMSQLITAIASGEEVQTTIALTRFPEIMRNI